MGFVNNGAVYDRIVAINVDVSNTPNAIARSARTGEMEDGNIIVLPVDNAVRVRTGDQGVNAI